MALTWIDQCSAASQQPPAKLDEINYYTKRIPSAGSCCCAMAVVLALQSVRHAPVANPLGAVARVFLEHLLTDDAKKGS